MTLAAERLDHRGLAAQDERAVAAAQRHQGLEREPDVMIGVAEDPVGVDAGERDLDPAGVTPGAAQVQRDAGALSGHAAGVEARHGDRIHTRLRKPERGAGGRGGAVELRD